jgi:serine/threonine-protein kinase
MDTDRNLLFGVLALQADLIDTQRFVEACSLWASRKQTPLADLLVERGWLTPSDRVDVEKLLERKLAKYGGDAKAGLAEATTDQVRQSLASVEDADVRQSLAGLTTPPQGHVLPSTTAYQPTGVDRYTLSRLHATGGVGRVWLARDASLGRDVALKELRPERADQPALWARFLREAQVTGQLEHPGIVPVYEVGRRSDEQPFYTMRFVRGRTLAEAAAGYHQRCGRGEATPLELRELLTAYVGVCQAVAYAHSRGVLHRDLKPQNVVLGDYGEVIVLDWGLAKVTGAADGEGADRAPVALAVEGARDETVAGQVLGTPVYMAPEQAEGRLDLLDARTDVYGLGAVLYEVLCGRPPFGGPDTLAVLRRVVHEAPQPPRSVVPGLPRALDAVCLKALAKKPAGRYATALELAGDVKRWLADEPVPAYRDPLTTRLTRWGRRHRTLTAALAVALVAVLGGLAAVLAVQRRANADLATKNRELAEQQTELAAKNRELAEQQAEVEARFQTAQKAIATFHTGVSEEALLKNPNLKELRTKLLKEAAGFYADLEKLLVGKTDAKSRKLLAEGYAQLGELTEKIGDKKQALGVQRQALALRRELALAPGADARARLEVVRNLVAVGRLRLETGDAAGALATFEEQRELGTALEAEAPTDALRSLLGAAHFGIGWVLREKGKLAEALTAFQRALAIRQQLADAHPAATPRQQDLAASYNSIAVVLNQTGRLAEALAAHERARDIRQRLVDAQPAATLLRQDLAQSYNNMGALLLQIGKPAEALAAYERARAIQQQLADDNPAATGFQYDLARSHNNIGVLLQQTGKPALALAAYERARDIKQKLVDADPGVTRFQQELAATYSNLGVLMLETGKPALALAAQERGRDIRQKLADADPAAAPFQQELATSYNNIGVLLQQTGKPAKALAAYERARDIQQKLADADSTVTLLQQELAKSHANIGLVLYQTGKPAEALAAYRKGRDIHQKLADAHPTATSFQIELATCHNNLGRLQARLKRFGEAFASLDAGLALRQKLAEAQPTVSVYPNHLGYSYAYRGAAHARAGHPALATGDLRRALELWAGLKDLDPETRSELGRTLALLAGLAGDPKSGVTGAEAKALADQAVGALRDAIQAGWGVAGELREPDFDALRRRDDFQKLQKELEEKGGGAGRGW